MDHLLGCRWNITAGRILARSLSPEQDLPLGLVPRNIAAMPTTSPAYRTALRLATVLTPALGGINSKLRQGDRARRKAGDRLIDWARQKRDRDRPLAWFHAASVGEGLQAESVLRRFRRLRPDCQLVYTHFSPSAEALARGLRVDAADYLPYDLPETMDRLLAALRPDLVVFAKLDVWPELSTRAAGAGAQVAIVAATVSPGSARLRWPARPLLEAGYRAITAAAAVSAEDAARLARLGVHPERIRLLGDPRFDSAVERVTADELHRFGRGAPTLVAGSTWPADEEVVLQAFARLQRGRSGARLIIVPHEPTPAHLESVERQAASLGLPRPVRLSQAQEPVPLLLVDRLGVLAILYGSGTIAYVGGGFGRAGLHSVLEPAAWGIPVVFGPHWSNSRDSALLLAAGGGAALPSRWLGRASRALLRHWEAWIDDEVERRARGQRAREVVLQGIGASDRSAQMLAELISERPLHRSPPAARSAPPSAR
jgi:3-deoxy-D-manno-octulosonic-acid transferase